MPPSSTAPSDVASWLETDFIASFERDVDPAIWSDVDDGTGRIHGRGFFAITLHTLAYCEAMAGLTVGKASGGTDATVRFLESEVGRIAGGIFVSRYAGRSAALYVLYRHRLAHQREPGALDVNGSRVLWNIGRQQPAEYHLQLNAVSSSTFQLQIDADRLNAHVRATFRSMRIRALSDPALAKLIYDGALEANSAKPYSGGTSGHVGTKLTSMLSAPD